jgi:uncharacterized oligopeptide transporter (OPT) family protein
MYFGLQTGWVTMGSIQSALIGYGIFQVLPTRGRPFGALENVVVQTVAVATATLPLAGGFIGIIPALGMLDPPVVLSLKQQLIWAAALTYFGIFFAVPLRRQTILVEQLRFPSGTATAKLIQLLHSDSLPTGSRPPSDFVIEEDGMGGPTGGGPPSPGAREGEQHAAADGPWRVLGWSFGASFGLSALCHFGLPHDDPTLHVFSWFGLPMLTTWRWTLRPALSYVGQGMIMGARPAFSLLGGAILGWGFLGPMARARHWAPGKIFDFEHGAQGWVLWVAIALMVSEALTAFLLVVAEQSALQLRGGSGGRARGARGAAADATGDDPVEVAPPSHLVPTRWWAGGAVAATALCVAVVSPLFEIPAWQVTLAVAFSCLVAVMAVRALGQTDLNPVSGVGKLSQIVFAIVAPGHVVANIVAGALAEAGAMQAGDLLQDLKAGHLLRASPRAQFFGQLVGATFSIFVTVGAYQLYDRAYGIPSAQFAAPVANVWKDMALLMQTGLSALPPSAVGWGKAFSAVGVSLPLLEALGPASLASVLPSGMSLGIGMYLTADFTIPRVLGALVELWWRRTNAATHRRHMLVVASGFVLGEGVWSIVALALKAASK